MKVAGEKGETGDVERCRPELPMLLEEVIHRLRFGRGHPGYGNVRIVSPLLGCDADRYEAILNFALQLVQLRGAPF